MYIQHYTRKKKSGTYQTTYIAESYREDGKVKRRHLCNLSDLPPELKQAICQTVYDFQSNNLSYNHLKPLQGKSCGLLIAFKQLAKEMGILTALGNDKQAKLALFQIIARVAAPRSRNYIANEWADTQAVEEVLGLRYFNEDDLYSNLDWLSEKQANIEQKLFSHRHKQKSIQSIYLYDVTSSYLEGKKNELAEFGYNRDKKKGKMQIVIGLLCDEQGYPVSVEVFEGNTSDSVTIPNQIEKLARRFHVKNVVIVGDKGMIKEAGIEQINSLNWHYITSITKNQIRTLLNNGSIQMELFTEELIETKMNDIRYILRKNPFRSQEIEKNREERLAKIQSMQHQLNQYLKEHPKAKPETALKNIQQCITKLKLSAWVNAEIHDREISITMDEEALANASLLDGCYVIKTNVNEKSADSHTIHQRYKDLGMVEQAFRTFKQSMEEIRPVYVRKSSRTHGHVFVCMLAYMLIKRMHELCKDLELTRWAIIEQLKQLQYIRYKEKNLEIKILPTQLNPRLNEIINKLQTKLPTYL